MRDLFAPLGWAYSNLAQLRRRLYTDNFFKINRLLKPVISVGNLTVGGTGKTPVVDALLTQIEGEGRRACVLTRGYGRESTAIIINPTKTSEGGDEPLWLSQRHTKSFVAVGADRIAAARLVEAADIFVLDDGFQHLQIKKDLEILLLDSTRPLWHYRPLPWGYGREDFSAIERAQIVILTRVNQASPKNLNELKAKINSFGPRQIVEASLTPGPCREIWSDKDIDISNKNIFLVSGIAHPESFETLAASLGGTIVGQHREKDHYIYDQGSIEKILKMAQLKKADIILTTEKDAVKWKELNKPSENVLMGRVAIELKFSPPLPSVYELAINRFR